MLCFLEREVELYGDLARVFEKDLVYAEVGNGALAVRNAVPFEVSGQCEFIGAEFDRVQRRSE